MKEVILIHGAARSGKDTIAKYMKKELEQKGKSVEILSFAEPLKQIIADTFGISLKDLDIYKNKSDVFTLNLFQEGNNEAKLLEQTNFRKILQRFGTEAMKPVFGHSVWVDLVVKKIKDSSAEYFIIPDFRFLIEADGIIQLANEDILQCYFISVYSDMSTIADKNHISENELNGFVFDYDLNNMKDKFHETEFLSTQILEDISK
jgi:hypothetical protein